MNDKYKCALCKKSFISNWTNEQALQEFKDVFGDLVENQKKVLICDDCYKAMIPNLPNFDRNNETKTNMRGVYKK
jgi:hypothetical protein